MERALIGFSKVINHLKQRGDTIPKMVIHSFTTYKKYMEKWNEFRELIRPDIICLLDRNLMYITLCPSDRLSKKKWFLKTVDNHPYTHHINDIKILEHIHFIHSL